MTKAATAAGYEHAHADLGAHHEYLLPTLTSLLRSTGATRVFEIGFGNGSVANQVTGLGYEVVGIDPSLRGLHQAKTAYPHLDLHSADVYEPLASRFGQFPVVYSLEVIEHVYSPRDFMRTAYALLEPGGMLILSTPYHGYLKNLAIALLGKFDRHVNPLWDHGHIKFWSIKTLRALLIEAGFEDIRFLRIGRVPPLAKSMIAIARKTSAGAATC